MKKQPFTKSKTWLKALSISSVLLFAASCSDEEVLTSDNLLSSSAKSSSSIELPISSISASTQQSNHPITNAYDNDSESRWSGQGREVEFDIDLGFNNTIDYLKIAYLKGNQRKAYFDYYYSTDGNTWTGGKSKTSTGETTSLEEFDLDNNSSARYIRLVCKGTSTGDWNSIFDIEVYGTPGEEITTTCNAANPSNRTSNPSTNSAVLSWTAIPNIDHYNVRWRTIDGTWSYKYSLDTNTLTITGLSAATDYEWQIRSKCSDDSSSAYNDSTNTFTTDGNDNIGTGGSVEDIIGDFWKVTMPVDADGNGSPKNCSEYDCRNNDAIDVYGLNEAAANSGYSDYFYEDNGWVVFKAFCGGATTENSQYPRCELRGLDSTGDDNYFDMDDYQELNVTVKVLSVPVERPEVNMVQIHGPDDEPLRIEYNTGSQGLHVTYNENNSWDNVMDYSIGDRLKVRVVVQNGKIEFWLENLDNGDTYSNDFNSSDDTGYFKVGCYLQSSISYCDVKASESFCSNGGQSDDYDATGSVAVTDLSMIRDGQTYK